MCVCVRGGGGGGGGGWLGAPQLPSLLNTEKWGKEKKNKILHSHMVCSMCVVMSGVHLNNSLCVVCVCYVVAVWCSGCVLGSGPNVEINLCMCSV